METRREETRTRRFITGNLTIGRAMPSDDGPGVPISDEDCKRYITGAIRRTLHDGFLNRYPNWEEMIVWDSDEREETYVVWTDEPPSED